MRYLCVVAYDGFDYYGYQKQNHEAKTIQQTIQEALKKLAKEDITIYASGRTDRQVHALGQTFHFDTNLNISNEAILKGMNSFLPNNIIIKSVKKIKEDFHARFNVKRKQYVYKIKNSIQINPFDVRYYAYIKETIDVDCLKAVAQLFIGTHNFKNFTTNKEQEVLSFEKTIYKVQIKQRKEEIEILFEGSGFLRYMVRMMVGAMLVVATNKKDISYVQNLLSLKSKEKCSYKASPQGLYLKKVIY